MDTGLPVADLSSAAGAMAGLGARGIRAVNPGESRSRHFRSGAGLGPSAAKLTSGAPKAATAVKVVSTVLGAVTR